MKALAQCTVAPLDHPLASHSLKKALDATVHSGLRLRTLEKCARPVDRANRVNVALPVNEAVDREITRKF